MGTLSKVRDNSQKIIWAFLITFILSMVAGGLMGGFNLVGQFKEWIGFNTSDQHAFSLDDERITHQSYANAYENNSGTSDDINIFAHILALNSFKQRNATNELYEDIFNSNQVSDVDILASITPETLILRSERINIALKQVPLKGYSEQFKDTDRNGLWSKQEDFDDANENGKLDQGEEFVDANDINKNGKWDEAEKFTDNKNGKWDEGEKFTDNKNGKWDEGEKFTDNKNDKWDEGEKYTDTDGNGKYDEGEEFVDAGNGDGVWNEGEGFVDAVNGKYDEGEKFEDGNGVWDSNTQDWIDQCIKNGKIDYSVIEDSYFRQLVKNTLSPTNQSYKFDKLASINKLLDYKTNHEIQFAEDLKNTEIKTDYIQYDLSSIDDAAIKIDDQDLKSKITPFKKYNSGFSNVTLIIITLLFLIYSYLNRENRAKLSFGGFFFVAMFLITIFKFMDYNGQGSDSLRKISYVHITKLPGNGQYDEDEAFIDTNGNKKWDEGEKYTDTLNDRYDKGEEFVDAGNGDGVWNEGEGFVDILNFQYDLGEEFIDTNKDGKWDEGEEFVDAGNGDGVWNEGEGFVDAKNAKWDIGEEFKDSAGLDINKAKNEIVKGITKDGLNIKYLEDNDLKKAFYEDINIVKNFISEDNANNVNLAQFSFLPDFINKTFEADLGDHFIIEDKSGTDINGFIIGFVHSEENYYKYSEYEKLKNEFIKNEKQKMAESKLKDLVITAKNMAKNKDIGISQLFSEYSPEEDFISYGTANDELNDVVINTFKNDPSVIGTLYAMNAGDASNIVYSSDDAYAYVFFMEEKNTEESEIDYEGEREKQNSTQITNRERMQSNVYFADMINNLNVLDWRNEASITVTVDPDTRATKNLSNLYFDYNSYLQLKNTLFNR